MKTHAIHHLARTVIVTILAATALCPIRARAGDGTAKPTSKCMMWTATSPTATVYLVGSMHLATPAIYPLPTEMEEAFAKADILTVEININKIDQQKMMTLVMGKGMYTGDETLSGTLKKETWEQVKAKCDEVGLPSAGVDKMKPWLVGMTIEELEIQKLGLDPTLGIDKHFLDLADKKQLKIDELESAEFQIDALADFDPKMQEKSLDMTLAELKDLKGELAALTQAWVAGDAKAMDDIITKPHKDHPEAHDVVQKLVFDRNGPMAQKIEAYLKGNKTVFVVVGCAHLVGDKGIVKILRGDRFKVEQSAANGKR